jgi:hypothetical protein
MKLVKDLLEGRIVFYWLFEDGIQVSHHLHTLQEAEEWWKEFMFAQYEGNNRRRSIHDRRKNHDHRKQLELIERYGRSNPLGRRETDSPIRVDIDLFQEKISRLTE